MNNAMHTMNTSIETLGTDIAALLEETPDINLDQPTQFSAAMKSNEMRVYMRRQTPSWETLPLSSRN
jgi:hypothetical protein